MKHGIDHDNLNVNIVMMFLYNYFKKAKAELLKEWKSYNRTIGAKGAHRTPWDIIEVKEESTQVKQVSTVKCEPGDEKWMACLLLSANRLVGSTVDTYVDTLRTKILAQLKLLGFKRGAFLPKTLSETWALDESYIKMVAAVDMFLFKFNTPELSNLRICTLRSRYKDCSGLLSIGYFCNLVNSEDKSQLLDWLYTEKLAEEVISMMSDQDELTQPHSYFPYRSDMKLVQNTYYSAARNPNLYFLIHDAGTLLRSAYAFSNSITLTKAFVSIGKTVEQSEERDDSGDGEPTTPDGMAWLFYVESKDQKLTPKDERICRES